MPESVPRRLVLLAILALGACDRSQQATPPAVAALPDEPSPPFRNVLQATAYVGDSACATCHADKASAYRQHAMAQSFRRWTPAIRVEPVLDQPIQNAPTGFQYSVVDSGGRLYQDELLIGPGGRRLHELRKRVDYVMGSGQVARTYFTEENGRLFQLPLTWYRTHGWDFSPGYEINNARFDRPMDDRCISCHSSYPRTVVEGKYADLPPGIGCERCHGPGALHVKERTAKVQPDSGYDHTIVNPAHLPLGRRMDVCEQCHVHTTVSVLRERKDDFSYVPSQALRDQAAFFKVAGSIDIVSHADRLRQSACFIATRATSRPLECATCHDPHLPPPDAQTRNQPCLTCHATDVLAQRLARSAALTDHSPTANCVSCHMPRVQERTVPHGTFTEHWIRKTAAPPSRATARRPNDSPIEPYYEQDRTGPEARIYQGMGEIVYATLANNGRVMGHAVGVLDSALGRDTTRGDARFLLGVAYQQLSRTDQAVRALQLAVRIDSTRPDRLRALAQAYERSGRPPADIDHLYRRALGLQPASAWIRADYADFLRDHGRREDAEQAYRAALAEQPSVAVAWFNLGTLLAEDRRLADASDAFAHAVHLDPSFGQALTQLLEINTTGNAVVGVRPLGSPLPALTVRERDPRAVQLTVSTEPGVAGVRFVNVPAGGLVQILKPDGTPVRALNSADGRALAWDLLTDNRTPIAGGLYRVYVQGRDPSGRPLAPQLFYFGVVHLGGA